MAAMPAALMLSGVLKSGSPAPKPITSTPSAFICLNMASIAMVVEACTADAILDSSFTGIAPLYLKIVFYYMTDHVILQVPD